MKIKPNKFTHPNLNYEFVNKLSEGSASKLFISRDRNTDERVLIKRINKREEWKQELSVLKLIKKQYRLKRLLEFIDFYETYRFAYIVTKLYKGYDLFDHIDINVPYKQDYARLLIKEMAKCIRDCHLIGIAHLDIKCENYIVTDSYPQPKLILIDFGHAEKIQQWNFKKGYSKYGTQYYLCPEGYYKYYSTASDIWSLGICAHLILTGDYPFNGTGKQYKKNMFNSNIKIKGDFPDYITQFITKCLHINWKERYTIEEVLDSDFLR